MLSIALASLVLYVVSMAIDLHLRALDRPRRQVEEAQLARAVLRQMADDLQSVVYPVSTDYSSASQRGSSGDQTMEGDTGALAGSAQSGTQASSGSSSQTLSLIPSEPGLYGDRYQMQVDVSRLPRRDQYVMWQESEGANLQDAVSDVKTVAYYMQSDASITRAVTAAGDRPGLYRRVLDRAATKWAMENGNYEGLQERAQLLAEEVIGLEFRYFDGTEWYEQWDSESYGSLPLAIEIAVEIAPSESAEADSEATGVAPRAGDLLQGERVYRLLVRLPTADVSGQYATDNTGGTSL